MVAVVLGEYIICPEPSVTICKLQTELLPLMLAEEIHRFPNEILELHGKYYWNIYSLYAELKKALVICAQKGIMPQSIGVDTWGVDFGYIAEDGTILALPRAYRDPYTNGVPDEFFNIVSRSEVYARTGIQIMNFNTLYSYN